LVGGEVSDSLGLEGEEEDERAGRSGLDGEWSAYSGRSLAGAGLLGSPGGYRFSFEVPNP
jgi:hypothetical protein